MAKCEQFQKFGVCEPHIDQFVPVEFLREHDESGNGTDPVPFLWELRANEEDIDRVLKPGDLEKYWICGDCHEICKQRLENQE